MGRLIIWNVMSLDGAFEGATPWDLSMHETVWGPELEALSKQQLAEEKAEKVHRYERAYGAFERSFTLPATVDPEHIKATYAAGVLTLLVPKVEKAKPRQIKVEVTPQLTP